MPIKKCEKIDEKLIQRTLMPYRGKSTAYLKSASTGFRLSETIDYSLKKDEDYIVQGQFSIHESCYIDDTGHFNAVEFNLCYNQLFYVAIAHACSQKRLNCLQDLTVSEFHKKQLPNIYITRLESHYKRVINSHEFVGIFRIKKAKRTRKITLLKTEIEFTDHHNGLAYGEVDVVIT